EVREERREPRRVAAHEVVVGVAPDPESPAHTREPTRRRILLIDELGERDEVPLAVLDPRGLHGAVVHDPVAEAAAGWRVVRLELDAAAPQLRRHLLDI